MRIMTKPLDIFFKAVCLLHLFLFSYAGLSKVLEFANFQAQLGQSPLLSAYTGFISYAVLTLEFILVFLLAYPKTRVAALYGSLFLMTSFSCYIFVILHYSVYVPCSCGGILEKMGWDEHLVFNIIFCLLACLGILAEYRRRKKERVYLLRPLIGLIVTATAAVALTLILYSRSEDIMSRENPFVRAYRQGLVEQTGDSDLNNYSFYFAGSYGKSIYLGNSKAPLQLVQYDTVLKKVTKIGIRLDREGLPFRTVSVRVEAPYFYVFDGTVPVVFKGNIKDWKAKVIMNENHYFSKAEVIGADSIIFTSRERVNRENVLGLFTFNNGIHTLFNKRILQRQIDGIFDTEGIMVPNSTDHSLLYLYSYRNQYTIVSSTMEVLARGNTIDTTHIAQVKPVRIDGSGEYKLASQPYKANLGAATRCNLLLVNSGARGRFEDPQMWKKASVIDVYDLRGRRYVASFYIYNYSTDKLSHLLILNNSLYVIVGRHLQKYEINKAFLRQLSKGAL